MDRWKGRVALVTGASVGIGAAIAKELVRYGMKVVGCARDVEKIQKLADECQSTGHSGVLVPFKCDLNNEEEILSMFAAIKAQHKGVDVCINNAGLAHPESLLNGNTSGWKNMLDINVLALCICTREAYQSMKERSVDDGHIININRVTFRMCALQFSLVYPRRAATMLAPRMSGHRVVPSTDVHFYSSTKYAVTALTEGLRQELREAKTHIRATCISPGVVETEFAPRLYRDNADKAAASYSKFKPLEAIDVANSVTYVLSAPPHVQIGDVQMRPVEQVL
ncbi:dehydrogenase/reductase SDR family member 11 isoform X1 [Perca flavescens]|uniref:dehydrogenase/reductase SDR family member 11 isoform X1 n=1 Tax=Perca flavescens TaxID=8167 RepID=UPI00106E4BC2|nr:dehydrogenase/reductase SDR family member 11-like isoform X1 [Perca flavescens]